MAETPEYYWLDSPPIIVDDSDPTIQYQGEWYAANESDILTTSFPERTPMFATLHVLQIFNGSLAYNFTGGGISVFATPWIDSSNYTAQCSVDGNPVNLNANSDKAQFGQGRPVCEVFGLPDDRTHTISVSVSVAPRAQEPLDSHLSGFSFDYLLIQPPSDAKSWDNDSQDVYLPLLDTAVAIGTSTHPTLNFGLAFIADSLQIADVSRGWEYDPENGFHTIVQGSQFNLTFTGTSLWWYAYTNANLTGPRDNFSATFAVDGGKPTKFPRLDESSSQSLRFWTPVLQYATHLVTVTYLSNDTLPLTLQSLVIQKSTRPESAPNGSGGSLPPSSTPKIPGGTSSPTAKRGHVGEIAGIIAGGVTFILLVACGVCILTRRASRRRCIERMAVRSPAATPEPFPIPIAATGGTLVPRKARESQDGIEHPATQQLQSPPLTKWSRLHTSIPARPDHNHMANSSSTKLEGEGLENPGPPADASVIQDDSQHPPIIMDTVNPQPLPQITDVLNAPTPNPFMSPDLSWAEGRTEEGTEPRAASVSDLPPAYTTQ